MSNPADTKPKLARELRDPKDAAYHGPVVAIDVGYHGRKRRDIGEQFSVKAGEFSSRWMQRVNPAKPVKPAPEADAGNGEGSDGGNGEGATDLVVIPEDWRTMHHKKRMALAKLISGIEPADTAQADAIIEAEAGNRDAKAKAAATSTPV